MLQARDLVAEMLQDRQTHVYVCGLKEMEAGVETAFEAIAHSLYLLLYSLNYNEKVRLLVALYF